MSCGIQPGRWVWTAGWRSSPLGGVRILRRGEPIAGLSNRLAQALRIYLASTRRFQPGEVLADFCLFKERICINALYLHSYLYLFF
jgi:hypothetical protein